MQSLTRRWRASDQQLFALTQLPSNALSAALWQGCGGSDSKRLCFGCRCVAACVSCVHPPDNSHEDASVFTERITWHACTSPGVVHAAERGCVQGSGTHQGTPGSGRIPAPARGTDEATGAPAWLTGSCARAGAAATACSGCLAEHRQGAQAAQSVPSAARACGAPASAGERRVGLWWAWRRRCGLTVCWWADSRLLGTQAAAVLAGRGAQVEQPEGRQCGSEGGGGCECAVSLVLSEADVVSVASGACLACPAGADA